MPSQPRITDDEFKKLIEVSASRLEDSADGVALHHSRGQGVSGVLPRLVGHFDRFIRLSTGHLNGIPEGVLWSKSTSRINVEPREFSDGAIGVVVSCCYEYVYYIDSAILPSSDSSKPRKNARPRKPKADSNGSKSIPLPLEGKT